MSEKINGTELVLYPENMNEESISKYRKISLAEFAAVSGAAAGFAEGFKTVTAQVNINGNGLYRAITKSGQELVNAADGIGQRGFVRGANGILEQAHFIKEESVSGFVQIPGTINPAAVCISFALLAMNKKLDYIQQGQKEIISLMIDDKMADLKGALATLNEIYIDYMNESDNMAFVDKKIDIVLGIKTDSQSKMVFFKEQLDKLSRNEKRDDKDKGSLSDNIVSSLNGYKLSIYLYAFSSVLEVMMFQNLSSATCSNAIERIENVCNEYRLVYTKCYDMLNHHLRHGFENQAKRAATKVVRGTGKAIGKIPGIEKGPVDELLIDAGDSIDKARHAKINKSMERLRLQKDNEVLGFVTLIQNLDMLINNQMEVFVDKDNVYIS